MPCASFKYCAISIKFLSSEEVTFFVGFVLGTGLSIKEDLNDGKTICFSQLAKTGFKTILAQIIKDTSIFVPRNQEHSWQHPIIRLWLPLNSNMRSPTWNTSNVNRWSLTLLS